MELCIRNKFWIDLCEGIVEKGVEYCILWQIYKDLSFGSPTTSAPV